MTAEIVIANRQGIALAADSAVTVGKDRVWKTANKLFSLGPNNDIGVMIHGSADYLGVGWETIVKMFKRHVGDNKYPTVKATIEDFIEFVMSDRFRDERTEELSISTFIVEKLEELKSALNYESKVEFRQQIKAYSDEIVDYAGSAKKICDMSLKSFTQEWGDTIKSLAKDVLEETITNGVRDNIIRAFHAICTHNVSSEYVTGVVFAGYGEEEIYPSLYACNIDGRCNDLKRWWYIRESSSLNQGGYVIPFGQADIIFSFMEGITPESLEFIESALDATIRAKSMDLLNNYVKDPDEKIVEERIQRDANNEIVKSVLEEFQAYRTRTVAVPVIRNVNTLPKEELAAMAEAMIEITSLRRRVASKLESVGGPVDVAVISKGDGFVWVKRKQYFDVEKNPEFLYREYRSTGGGQ
ncbi:hypothetical protein [Brevundimonas aurantiaca]|uniref:hypothetical protein n=1 Tax=Brevundimonas aurantiaca TaxID=74316 RepID=UPI003017CD7A